MFDDLGTLCLVAVFVIVGLMLLPRLLSGLGSPNYSQRGDEAPRHDSPDINSSGGFGGTSQQQPGNDDPDISSRGSFGNSSGGRRRFSLPSWNQRKSDSDKPDNPDISSRGGFGRSKN